jgi:hypothetical protein
MAVKLVWERDKGEGSFLFMRLGGVLLGGVTLSADQMRCWAKCSLPGIRPAEAMFDSGAGAKRFVEDAVRMWFAAAGHPLAGPSAPAATELHTAALPHEDRDYHRAGGAR